MKHLPAKAVRGHGFCMLCAYDDIYTHTTRHYQDTWGSWEVCDRHFKQFLEENDEDIRQKKRRNKTY
jgi:hypothetical protein